MEEIKSLIKMLLVQTISTIYIFIYFYKILDEPLFSQKVITNDYPVK